MAIKRICAHCGKPMDGFASMGDKWLCHPDDESKPDCYHLVTCYYHPMPCPDCPGPKNMGETDTVKWILHIVAEEAEEQAEKEEAEQCISVRTRRPLSGLP